MKRTRKAFVVVRPTADDVLDDDLNVIVSGHPTLPPTWEHSSIIDGWTQHKRPDGLLLHVLRVNTSQVDLTDGVFLVVQREPSGFAELINLAGRAGNKVAQPMRTLWDAARAGNVQARATLRHWPDWLVRGFVKDDLGNPQAFRGVRRMFRRDSGSRLPSNVFTGSGPWHLDSTGSGVPHNDPTEVIHVTRWIRPGLTQEVAGYDDHTPEAGTVEDDI